jgi:hypothetical protein
MTIKIYGRKKDGTAEGGIEYADKAKGAVFLDMPIGAWMAIEAANPYKVKSQTGSLNFEEVLSEEQARIEFELFRIVFLDPLDLDSWGRFHPLENKSKKPKPHSAIHIGINSRVRDGRQITPFFGAAKFRGRDFKVLDLYKRWRNKEMGYSSPDDPAKQQKDRTRIKRMWPKAKKEFVRELDSKLRSREWDNRDEIIAWLEQELKVEISRKTKTTVSIRHSDWPISIRLEGHWWNEDWSKVPDQTPFIDRPASELLADLKEQLVRRAEYFEKKYKFTLRNKSNDRTKYIEPLTKVSTRRDKSPIPDRDTGGSEAKSGRNEPAPKRRESTGRSDASQDVGSRANLNETWETWSALERHVRQKLIAVEDPEEGFMTHRELTETVKKVRNLMAGVEEEWALRSEQQKQLQPEPHPSVDPEETPKKDDNPPI